MMSAFITELCYLFGPALFIVLLTLFGANKSESEEIWLCEVSENRYYWKRTTEEAE